MSYYEYFALTQEPFSTSPDPGFFWLSESHRAAICRLQVAVKLKRGLSILLGDVGTGKTTLSRRLLQVMQNPQIEFHPIFTPFAKTDIQFMHLLLEAFQLKVSHHATGFIVGALSTIENYLLRRGLEEGKTIVLVIDEAQKLIPEALEILRALLNYESHREKLLQVVLMGQAELLPKLTRTKNLWDRVSLKQILRPLTVVETQKLIQFRLERAGWQKKEGLFSSEACELIYQISHGYPRQITRLAHDALEMAVMVDQRVIDRPLIEKLIEDEHSFFEIAQTLSREANLREEQGTADLLEGE